MVSKLFTKLILLSTTFPAVLSLNNGLALTPPMGWNSYNHYGCNPNQSIVHSNAQAILDLGLQAVGYHYVTVDCGWTLPEREKNGTLKWNPALFKDGPYALAEFLHAHGLGFGVYSDGGRKMCMIGEPAQAGSLNHENIDADSFASIGADLLKYDNCYSDASSGFPEVQYTPDESPSPNYSKMSRAVTSTGRKILFQVCDWGVDFPSAWAPKLGNSWRVANDIYPPIITNGAYSTIARILNQVVPQTDFAGPGQWLDLDMMEVGNNVFTTYEEQTHISLWAIIKSPLIIGAALKDNYKTINNVSLGILKNPSVISYNQDSLGVAASFKRRWTKAGYELWAGPLSDGRTVAAVINLFDKPQNLTLDLPDIGLQSAGIVKDIWNNVSSNDVLTSYSAIVAPHGTLLLELQGSTAAGLYNSTFASTTGTTTTYNSIYGITTSNSYSMNIIFSSASNSTSTITILTSNQSLESYTLPANEKQLVVPLSLLAANNNTISITSPLTPSALNITVPPSTFYHSTDFALFGDSSLTTCFAGLCAPVGSKITNLSPIGSAKISISSTSSTSSSLSALTLSSKFVNIYFCNNDITFDNGTNTRNLTLQLNYQEPVRVELPLSGRSSELFSPYGWEDTGVFGVLLEGWLDGANDLVVGNAYGSEGVQSYGADLVGVEVFW